MTYYLRFPSVEKAMEMLTQANYLDQNGDVICASHNHSIDVIGVIIIEDNTSLNQEDNPSAIQLDGWHLNFQGDLPIEWTEFLVTPERPVRVFF